MTAFDTLGERLFSPSIRRALLIAIIGVVLLLVVSYFMPAQGGFRSSELRFTDASSKGLAIVPASCPSYPRHATQVSGYTCQGKDVYTVMGNCSQVYSHTCGWQCLNGACLIPPPPSFGAFTATNPPGSGGSGSGSGGTFEATGHLQVKPLLVRQGDKVRVYWNVVGAQSCTVTANNPAHDTWTGDNPTQETSVAISSGSAGKESSAIESQTVFTMTCTSLPDAVPASITEIQTVNIVPVFQET